MRIAGQEPSVSRRAMIEIAIGAIMIVSGAVMLAAISDDTAFVIGGGPVFAGLVVLLHGMSGLAGYKSFVAWRYLLNHHQRVSRRTRILIGIGMIAYLPASGLNLVSGGASQGAGQELDLHNPVHVGLLITSLYMTIVVFSGV